MLVLSRNVGQWIDIDGPCRILISQIHDRTVRIGIEADAVDDVRDQFQSRQAFLIAQQRLEQWREF